jgi:hypothetical protein
VVREGQVWIPACAAESVLNWMIRVHRQDRRTGARKNLQL